MIEEVVKTFTQHEHHFENNIIIFFDKCFNFIGVDLFEKKKILTIIYQAMIKYQHIFMVEEGDRYGQKKGDKENSYFRCIQVCVITCD